MPAHVYILASGRNGTLYPGVTSNLSRRLFEHQYDLLDGFSKRYNVTRLVYVEEHERVEDALVREKQLKSWRRAWKIALIEESNPEWSDLSEGGLF
nr:GIY-YIG nuclease family protein [uncultured Roseibium sp.]